MTPKVDSLKGDKPMPTNYRQIFALREKNRKKWLEVNPKLTEASGIYIITRVDEHGIKYAYVGQAKHVLTRLADHLNQYEHIDLSIKKHGLKSKENPYGYEVEQRNCPEEVLDYWEKIWIKEYSNLGYQLRNNTVGGQGKGHDALGERKSGKGYHDGVAYGYAKAWREVAEYLNKYFRISFNSKAYTKAGKVKKLFQDKGHEFAEKMNDAQKKN